MRLLREPGAKIPTLQLKTASPSPITVEAVLARLQREVSARKVGEEALEERNRELELAGRNQERLLGGGVKLMTDILTTARPEVFQKAAKVQRWARRLAKSIKVKNGWELDLAALHYPLGVISLPDELAAHYAADLPLDEADALRIEESALVASRLIANMPRMNAVARTVFYARKGYDGSGWPKDGPSGAELPQSARILKVLIDLADAATGASRTREGAFQKMSLNQQRYDPEIFNAAYDVLLVPVDELGEGQIMVNPVLARTGDVLVHDLTDEDGRLLLSAGTRLTELSARRLLSLAQTSKLPAEIAVARDEKTDESPSDLPDEELSRQRAGGGFASGGLLLRWFGVGLAPT